MVYRALVVSDIHSNLEAFEAVLADAEGYGPYTDKLCAGDSIGYCSDPNPVLERLRTDGFQHVSGDHEKGIIGIYDEVKRLPKKDRQNRLSEFAQKCASEREMGKRYIDCFNDFAIAAAVLNANGLTPENLEYLRGLSNKPIVDGEGKFAMVHGSFNGSLQGHPRYVVEGVYVMDEKEAAKAMQSLTFFNGELTYPEELYMPNQLPQEIEDSNIARFIDFKEGTQHIPIGIIGHTHTPAFASCVFPTANIKGVYKGHGDDFLIAMPEDLNFARYCGDNIPTIRTNVRALPKTLKKTIPGWFKRGYEGYRSFDDLLHSVFLRKILVNPGSVGQPRNFSPEANYLIVELLDDGTATFDFKAVEYDVETTQRKMRERGYPEQLAVRLAQGR